MDSLEDKRHYNEFGGNERLKPSLFSQGSQFAHGLSDAPRPHRPAQGVRQPVLTTTRHTDPSCRPVPNAVWLCPSARLSVSLFMGLF